MGIDFKEVAATRTDMKRYVDRNSDTSDSLRQLIKSSSNKDAIKILKVCKETGKLEEE